MDSSNLRGAGGAALPAKAALAGLLLWACALLAAPAWAQPKPAAQPARTTPAVAPAAKAPPKAAAGAPTPARPALVERPYKIAPLPAWVVDTPMPDRFPTQQAPMVYRLVEDQFHVDDKGWSEFSRVVRVARDANGLAAAAQWELRFDPSYQTMTLHRLDVIRGGVRQSRLAQQRIDVLQREERLEQRLYDGQLSLSIVLDDVRVGDEIDVAYTVSGANPVFGGRFVHLSWMGTDRGPVARWQTRLLAPATRTIHTRLGPTDARVTQSLRGDLRETVWVRDDVAAQVGEPGMPWSATTPELLQFSEFKDWAEVAAWGAALFDESGPAGAVAAKADEIRAAHATPQARLTEALRFVQQEVRYFGVAIGPGSHRPHAPQRVLEQRFGDCKDKVTLLAALLRRLELPVRPVLVSARLRERVDEMLPSPLAFDHVIARVELNGQPLVLDPTRAQQSGPLRARQATFSRGLDLSAGAQALSPLPEPYEQLVLAVDDLVKVADFAKGAELHARITWHGELAESIRAAVAERGAAALADAVSTHYVRIYPGLRRLDAPRTEDATDADAVTLVQRFELPEVWRYADQRALQADVLMWAGLEALLPPKTEGRRHPLGFQSPGRYRHRVRVEFPEAVFRESGSRQLDERDRHFTMAIELEGAPSYVEYRSDVRVLVDRVETQNWNAYQQALQRALPKLSVTFGVPAISLARSEALVRELRELDDQSRSSRRRITQTQIRSEIESRAFTAQLETGRLPALPRAQALVARGIALDLLGQHDRGRADFEAALALQADLVPALNAAATNAQVRGDVTQTLDYAARVLQRQPRDSGALSTRARALYLADRHDEAKADLEQLLSQRSEQRRGYPLAWLALTTARSGGDLKALRDRFPPVDWPTDWPRPILDMLLVDGDTAALLRAARASRTPLEAQTEAQFFIGEHLAIKGDISAARNAWKQAVELGVTEYVEHSAARQRLARQPR